jgi:hypothetical protein
MTVVKEIAKYKLDLVRIQGVRWDRVAPNQQENIHLPMERGMRIMK